MIDSFGGAQATYLTATAATPITWLMPPRARSFARIRRTRYRTAGTAHALAWMKCLGQTTLAAAALISATTVTLSADPGTGTPASVIATNDWIAIELNDGSFDLRKVTVAALVMTIAALTAAAAAGLRVFFFGAPADHVSSQTNVKVNPVVGSAQTTVASSTQDFDGGEAGICQSLNQNEPLMFYSDNGTAAGFLELIAGSYDRN